MILLLIGCKQSSSELMKYSTYDVFELKMWESIKVEAGSKLSNGIIHKLTMARKIDGSIKGVKMIIGITDGSDTTFVKSFYGGEYLSMNDCFYELESPLLPDSIVRFLDGVPSGEK